MKAKLLRPFGERADLLFAIPGFVVFGPFVDILLSVFEESVEPELCTQSTSSVGPVGLMPFVAEEDSSVFRCSITS